MDPRYEFLSIERVKLLNQSKQTGLLRNSGIIPVSFRGRVLVRIGNGMITCGSWLKKISGSNLEQNSSILISQN